MSDPRMFDSSFTLARPNGHHGPDDEGLEHVAVVPPNAPEPPPLRGSSRWWYTSPEGERISAVERIEPRRLDDRKTILPLTLWRSPTGALVWKCKHHPSPRPLYNLDKLARWSSAPVIVVEGEKKVEAAERLFPEHVATCSSGGSNAADKTDWSPCAGRDIVIWPDNDEAGARYAGAVAGLVQVAGASSVRIVDVPSDWPVAWDLADTPPVGVTDGKLREMLDKPTLIGITGGRTETDAVAEFARLAVLDPVEYDRQRKTVAGSLRIRSKTLDDEVRREREKQRHTVADTDLNRDSKALLKHLVPWHAPVKGEVLCNAIARNLSRFAVLPAGAETAVTLWCLHAHAHEAAQHGPVLAIQSPEKRCGKTTVLSMVLRIVPMPLPAANITVAALFRSVEKYQPTLLIDEGDSFLRDNEDMRGILNSGFTRDTAFVIRCDGEDFEPRPFSTWCPKLIASIGKLPDTLQDRSIAVVLRRKLDTDVVERFTPSHHQSFDQLAQQAARWSADNIEALLSADPDVPEGLHDRARDCWRPLLAIADAVGGHWPETARKAAVELSGGTNDTDPGSAGTILLAHVKDVLNSAAGIGSTKLVQELIARDDWPWREWRQGRPISTHGVAKLLAPYGIAPKHGRDGSYYIAATFADAWRRYLPKLPPTASVTSTTNATILLNNNGLNDADRRFSSVTDPPSVIDCDTELPNKFNGVTLVTDAMGRDIDEDIVAVVL